MNALHPNVKFMRHPEHDILKTNIISAAETAFWSHHDKAIVIDDKLVFWGGLDSCFGRWDYNAHPLADLHADIRKEIWVGQDYNNARIMDFEDVGDWRANMLNRTESARMPWHDVSMSAKGPIVHSFSAHFIQRWNFVKKVKSLEYSRFPPLVPPPSDIMHDTVKPLTDRFTQQIQPFADRFAQSLHLHHGSEATFGTGPPTIDTPAAGPPAGGTAAQLCRSATEWSQGVPHEKSIQNAYISLIEHATRISFHCSLI
jgi:phospholipase D1/2